MRLGRNKLDCFFWLFSLWSFAAEDGQHRTGCTGHNAEHCARFSPGAEWSQAVSADDNQVAAFRLDQLQNRFGRLTKFNRASRHAPVACRRSYELVQLCVKKGRELAFGPCAFEIGRMYMAE